MQLSQDAIARVCDDGDVYGELLELDGKRIVELGCGTAVHTRAIATGGRDRVVTAFEVDTVQLARNRAIADLPNVSFRYGGAEAIACDDASTDVVFMFKSLHHVPRTVMATALGDISRILKPGGYAYISEPIFAGNLNDIIKLFHDEEAVRQAAFAAIRAAVADGTFILAAEVFFLAPTTFRDFAEFEARIIKATHTAHRLSDDTYARVRTLFARYADDNGATFAAPMRVDLLHKPLA